MIFFSLDLMLKLIFAGILAGFAASTMGVFVVRLKMTTIGYCMAHAAFAGAALGLLIESHLILAEIDVVINLPLLMAFLFTVLTAVLLGPLSEKTKLDVNVILGFLFSLMLALGFIFLNYLPSGVISSAAVTVLWGSIFGVMYEDLIFLGITSALIIIILIFFYKEFLSIMFNKKMALASGINVSQFTFILLLLNGVVITFSINIIGALLVYALIVNPASTAFQFFYDMKKIFIFSAIGGVADSVAGIFVSLIFDLPIGSSIIIVSCIVFIIAVIISPKRKWKVKKKSEQKV
jgi:ABC-type Mn2+/Zn2+ transport system permease subunit